MRGTVILSDNLKIGGHMPNQTIIDYSHLSVEDLYAERVKLLEELAEFCVEEAQIATRKAQLLHDIHAVETELAKRDV